MLQFFAAALATLSSSFSIEALSFETEELLLSPLNPFLISTAFPILYRKQIDALGQSKRVEEALCDEERFANPIAELSPVVINVFDLAKRRDVYISPDVVSLLGYTTKEIAEMEDPFSALWHPEDVTAAREHLTRLRAAADGAISELEYRIRHRDGEWRWMSTRGTPFARDEHGAVREIVTATVDITERKQTEDALKESRRYLQALFDNSLDAILVTNDEGRYIDANPAACELLGYTNEELMQLSVLDLTAEPFRHEGWAMWQQFLAKGSQSGEYSTLRKDGTVLQLEFRAVANILPGLHLSSSRDITERKRAEDAQREAELKYRDIFENALEGIFQIRPDGGYISANPALARMLGFNCPEELIRERSDHSKRRYVDPRRRQEYIRLLSEEGGVRDFEYEDHRKDGSIIWVSDNVHPVRDGQGTLLYYEGTTQDITERKWVERAQRESQQQYEALVHSIDGIVWEADPQTFTFTFVSKQAERILGYPVEQWFEGPSFWPDHMHPDDRDWAVAYCLDLTNRKVDHRFEYRMIAADGHVVWLSDIVTVHVGDDQSVLLRGVMLDITERKLIEEKLKRSESQLGEAQRLASIGSWNWDIRNNTHTWSDELYHICGLHRDESAPSFEMFMELLHPDDRIPIREAIDHALNTQEPINSYLRIIRPDGVERIIHSRGNTISDVSGTPIRMHGTVQDVTERKQAEDALRAAEQKYRDIFENAGEGIFQSTPDGRFIAANPALARMHGFASPEELIHSRQDISRQIYVDPARREEFKRQLEEQGAVRGFEHQVLRKDWSKIWVSVNARAVRDEQGAIQYYEGTAQDVTQRKLVEKELGRSEEMYRGLVEQAPDAIFIASPNLHFIDLNARACELGGYTKDEILQMSIPDFMPPEDILSAPLRLKELREGKTVVAERRLRRKDGTLVPVEVSTKILSDGRLQAIVRDITERKQAEAALQESEERFRQLSEAAFEAIILHDNGTILEVNQSFCRQYGYERAEVIGKSVLDLAPPEFRELLLQRVRSGDTDPYEGLALRKDGSIFRAELAGKPIHYQGRVVRVAAIRDITEQKRNERRQAAQYAVTRVLAESATLADTLPKLLQVICESLRWKMGEFWRVCDSPSLLRCVETWHVPGLDAAAFIEASRQTELAPGVDLPGRVWQSGQPAWIPDVVTDPRFARAAIAAKVGLSSAVAFPILLGNNTLGVIQFFSHRTAEVDQDLLKMMSAIGSQIGQFTERKQIEEALRESEERYRDLVENSREFICTHDLDGLILSANRAAAEMLGYDLKDCCGKKNYRDLLVPEVRDQFDDYLARLRRDGVASGLTLVQTSSGERRLWEYYNTLRTEGVATPIVRGMARDITERKRAEIRSAAFANLAQKLSGAMTPLDAGQIIAQTAHDLFGWDSCTLDLYDAEHDVIHPMLNVDTIGGKQVDVTPFISGRKPTPRGRRVIDHGSELILRKEPFVFDTDAVPFGDVSRPSAAIMTAPIRHASRVIGVLSIHSYRPLAYDDVAMGDLQALADHCGEALNRIQAEEQLRESEERYRDLVEHSSELICTHDLDGLILSANRAATEGLGHDREDYFGKKNLREILTPEALEGFEDYLARIRNDGVASGIMLVQTSSGEQRIWEYHNTLRTAGVAAPIVRGMARDITDRRRAEEALRESEERYRELFENAKDATFVHDLSGRYTSVNRAAEKLLGYARAEILGKEAIHFFPPEQIEHLRECSRKLVEKGETAYETEVITKDGRRVAVGVESHLIFENGVAIAVQGTARDITERKAAEEKLKSSTEQLRESEERYRELFENAKDVTYVHDLNGRYMSVNRAAEKLSGYARSEILGKSFTSFIPSEHTATIRQQLCRKLFEEGETSYESEVITKDGRRVAIEVNSHLILENGVPVGVQGTARDITERKAAEEKLKASSEQLRALSARLQSAREEEGTRIAREIHDELGSMLTSLKWDLEGTERILASPMEPSQLAALREKLQALMKLTDVAIGSIRRIASELRPSVLDDLGLAAAIEWQAQQFQARTGIVCECDCSLKTLDLSEEQSTALFRILQEALTNVLRHAQATRVDIKINKKNGYFTLSITDNGKGITESDKSEQQLGILGMRERAHLIGGEIDIKGLEGKGTVVTVRVPISGSDRVLKMTH